MSEQKELQEDAARLRRCLLGLVKGGIESGMLPADRRSFIEEMAGLVTQIAGHPSAPLEYIGAYASTESKPAAESKA